MQRMVVVLPAPFGPRKPVTLPGSMPNVRSSTAVLSPYRFVRPRTSIMGKWSSLFWETVQFWPAPAGRRVGQGDDSALLLRVETIVGRWGGAGAENSLRRAPEL